MPMATSAKKIKLKINKCKIWNVFNSMLSAKMAEKLLPV